MAKDQIVRSKPASSTLPSLKSASLNPDTNKDIKTVSNPTQSTIAKPKGKSPPKRKPLLSPIIKVLPREGQAIANKIWILQLHPNIQSQSMKVEQLKAECPTQDFARLLRKGIAWSKPMKNKSVPWLKKSLTWEDKTSISNSRKPATNPNKSVV